MTPAGKEVAAICPTCHGRREITFPVTRPLDEAQLSLAPPSALNITYTTAPCPDCAPDAPAVHKPPVP